MCAGATVFNAVHHDSVRPTHVVGVIGVSGLGPLAIQFAAKMGRRVVVFSGTDSKREEVMGLGASQFVAMKNLRSQRLSVTSTSSLSLPPPSLNENR